jgi:hypothetical protein
MKKRTPWTEEQRKEFREANEKIIAMYPEVVQHELRGYREAFLGGIPSAVQNKSSK